MTFGKFYRLNPDRSTSVIDGPDPLMTWARAFESEDRRVAFTQLAPGVEVSTVFLGLDHEFLGDGPPLLFETMIFGGPLDGEQWRYASYDDAMTGHQMAVSKAREALGQRVSEVHGTGK